MQIRSWFMASAAVLSASAVAALLVSNASPVLGQSASLGKCHGLPTAGQLKTWLNAASDPTVGGLFNGDRMWGAVVNRHGEICASTTSTDDPTQVWPGSQAIAKAKAYTANAFSLDTLALSTARLYTLTQQGHSLASLGQSNLWDPHFLAPPTGQGGGKNQIAGGLIFFGGGVALYNGGSTVIGGLGISGDTACADHEVAKRVRTLAGLNPTLGPDVDDILYPVDGPSPFMHPFCLNTWRDGAGPIGTETPANTY